jgi:antitoxin (DNA-binding transcriptional repressor) of toxin-antitoxin stability system
MADPNEPLRRVSNGETIRITRHGIPLAKIVPIRGEEFPVRDRKGLRIKRGSSMRYERERGTERCICRLGSSMVTRGLVPATPDLDSQMPPAITCIAGSDLRPHHAQAFSELYFSSSPG